MKRNTRTKYAIPTALVLTLLSGAAGNGEVQVRPEPSDWPEEGGIERGFQHNSCGVISAV